ncbi:MAG: hypothetical protein KA015_01395 [Spirochaetes bacterium]|nr:hypothetical protein [Spirochaetota bacterium]
MAVMIDKVQNLILIFKGKIYCVSACLLGTVFLSALIISLRTIDIDKLLLSNTGLFAVYFFVSFIVLFMLSVLAAAFFIKLDVKPGIVLTGLLIAPLIIPPNISAVIFDLFFSPREGFLAYIGDKYNIAFLNDFLLNDYSLLNFSFIIYLWKMSGSAVVLLFILIKGIYWKVRSGLIFKVLFVFRLLPFLLILFVAFVHQIPVIIACYVSRYEYVYSFPGCFAPENFTFFYSAVIALIAILSLLSLFVSKRTCLN